MFIVFMVFLIIFFPLGAVIIRLQHEIVVLSYLVFAFDLRLVEVFTGWS